MECRSDGYPDVAVLVPSTECQETGAWHKRLYNCGFFGRADAAAHSVTVHLSAPVTVGAVVLAVVLAIAGGLIAGGFGGWRAARLRPAAALSRVE